MAFYLIFKEEWKGDSKGLFHRLVAIAIEDRIEGAIQEDKVVFDMNEGRIVGLPHV